MSHPHTPGPWTATPLADGRHRVIPIMADNPQGERSRVGTADSSHFDVPTCEANARLMSAAPELLSALQKIAAPENFVTAESWRSCAREIAVAAIARATT